MTTHTPRPAPKLTTRLSALLASAAMLAGCAASPDTVYRAAEPKAQPVAANTNFSDALTCMDDMLYAYGIRDIRLTTNGIPDSTGEIQVGTRDMFISAVSRMSSRSRAFTYIDFEEVTSGFGPAPDRRFYDRQQSLLTPTYYVRGAITTFDENVVTDTQGGGLRVGGTGAGVNFDATSSVVGLDMNVGEVKTGLIVPGVASSNRIAVTRRSLAGDVSFDVEIGSELVGGFAQAARSKSEGMHTAVRTLVELNTVESLGKLTRVPYWRCLGLEQATPAAEREAGKYYRAMSERERTEFVQRALAGQDLYTGAIDGTSNAALQEAIGQYQASNNLIATGRIDRQLVSSLYGRDMTLAGRGKPIEGAGASVDDVIAERLFISMTDTLEFPTYKVDMPLQMRVRLNADAYLYCYYRDGAGTVARIFPNRFQPNARVSGGTLVKIPDDGAGFRIVFEQAGATENVKCFASRSEIGVDFPETLKQADLTPIAMGDLRVLEQAIRAVAPDDLAVNTSEFLIR
ncbi:MAG: DUF4384 domain-containing protein [Pseudomonadota bacterium]